MSISPQSPFLKWAGGKRWLIRSQPEIFSTEFERYFEPFLGGGAIYFHLSPKSAVISDTNHNLINLYNQIKNNWQTVQKLLKTHQERHSEAYYYHVRSLKSDNKAEQAAQLLYLNRTCWNGLFRVNKKGEFNVPIGTKNTVLMPGESLENISRSLKGAEIMVSDFQATIEKSKNGDLIFADPPYTVKHNNNGFLKYNESIFNWRDQERLAESLISAKNRGVQVIGTNADHKSVHSLYENEFHIYTLSRTSVLAGKRTARGGTTEILISSAPLNLVAKKKSDEGFIY